jgi:hypothetical protein
MLRLWNLLIYGTWHTHEWEIIQTVNVLGGTPLNPWTYEPIEVPQEEKNVPIGRKYVLRCKGGGDLTERKFVN